MLLGDRYGSRPIPATIPEAEMDLILAKVVSGPDQDLLQEWYIKDTNAKPPEYVLQEIYKNMGLKSRDSENYEEEISKAREKWKNVEDQLKECLRKCVRQCVADGSIGKEHAERYFWSGKVKEARYFFLSPFYYSNSIKYRYVC